MVNSIDVIEPFARALDDKALREVQIIGGVNSAALVHPDTVIDFNNKEVIAPDDLYLPTVRDDKTKTLRDLDIFVKTSNLDYIDEISRKVEETVGDAMEQSVFGMVSGENLKRQIKRPMGITALKTFLSDRYDIPYSLELPGGMVSKGGMVKSLFPFAVPLEEESLESWMLTVGSMRVPIPNPVMSVINYTNRSISGVRPKDAAKIEKMAASVIDKAPELRDWAVDGPGAKQLELGLLLRSLTPDNNHTDYFGVNRPILPQNELTESEMFMLPDLSEKRKRRIARVAVLKANGLSFFESNPTVVSLWQRYIEPFMDFVVKNK